MKKREQFILENIIYLGNVSPSWHLFTTEGWPHNWRYAIAIDGVDYLIMTRAGMPPDFNLRLSKRFIAILKMAAFPVII